MARSGDGGALFINFHNSLSTLICSNSSLNRNQAKENGGAMFITSESYVSTNVQILSCNFSDNMAIYGNGGAAFMSFPTSSSTLSCSSSIFNRNQANENGGSIYISQGGEYVWRNISFSNNLAENGGAVYFDSKQIQNNTHNFSYCQWHNNTANISGGAVYVIQSESQYFFHCHWLKNTANTSAAFLVSNVSHVALVNCTLTCNRVQAILNDLAGTNCIVTSVTSRVFLTNVTIEKSSGSGLCSNQSSISLSGTNTFATNMGYKGGGINLVSESLLHLHSMTELIFEANNATYGGGLYQNNFGTNAIRERHASVPVITSLYFRYIANRNLYSC